MLFREASAAFSFFFDPGLSQLWGDRDCRAVDRPSFEGGGGRMVQTRSDKPFGEKDALTEVGPSG